MVAKSQTRMVRTTRLTLFVPKTVGELRALLATLPDDMPLHHHGMMGDHPPGLPLVIRNLAAAKNDPSYFADVKTDTVWSKRKYADSFGNAVPALCST